MVSKTLGGDRLGSGKKQKIHMHGYERSTHDLSYIWKSTQAPGTLVPFMKQVGLPGDTFDISLDCNVLTLPTIGPLFGSFKVQLDVFQCPVRLYQAKLHNNKLKIGLDMSQVVLPVIEMTAQQTPSQIGDKDNWQINPSSLLAYLGIRGVGIGTADAPIVRTFNAIPILAYWEIYKNYYANKQEEIGAVLHTPSSALITTVTAITIDGNTINQHPVTGVYTITPGKILNISFTGTQPDPTQIIFEMQDPSGNFQYISAYQLCGNFIWLASAGILNGNISSLYDGYNIFDWDYQKPNTVGQGKPSVTTFNLDNIDQMRDYILTHTIFNVKVNDAGLEPYKFLYEAPNSIPNILSSQEGLALKTYQSDLFNNWLQTEWIDGTSGVNEVTKIDVTSGYLKIDQLNLAKKVYDILNRIAVSGGSYKDWLDVVYDHDVPWIPESPMYMGGLSKELVFQAVVSNAQAGGANGQPLGTLAGRGVLSSKHKGGNVTIKVDEPSYIMGIVSLTPRLDYSQGNDWDVYTIKTMNDFHQPGLDEIGFQELITEQMHWASTKYDTVGTKWVQKSAGKQPAWINYMTSVNKSLGNFAIETDSMFMTLNRRYDVDIATGDINDLTTYIDPSKYNNIFAQTSLDAQNFWVQIGVNITARRKMSARVMPNV